MVFGTKPPESIIALAKKLHLPVTHLQWGRRSREWLKTRSIETNIKRILLQKGIKYTRQFS